MAEKNRSNQRRGDDENRDPISGAPGAHPVGTGLGAAAGGAAGGAGAAALAGAAAGTGIGGPIGTVAGAAVGAVAGGLIGKGIAERVNPTQEDAYWREQYQREPYYNKDYTYDDYQGAYRTGYEGWGLYGSQGRTYDQAEPDLRREYEKNYGKSRLSWDQARHATRAAWSRFDRDLSKYIGYDVVDQNNDKIGTLECLWSDHQGEPAFIGVRTGWFFGKNHVVPAQQVNVNERDKRIRLPYGKDRVKDAPAFDADADIQVNDEQTIYSYYGLATAQRTGATQQRAQTQGTMTSGQNTTQQRAGDERTIKLAQEDVKIGKREVEVGGVRLRKVVRTETVNQPVQLKREEIVIERVPATESGAATTEFSDKEIYIPLRREEAVVEKQTHVREEVRVRKQARTDEQQVSEEVRREDVEIEETGEARRTGTGRRAGSGMRESEEVPRSKRQSDR
ncbi:MAG TPA: PRC and DUF2382 domain-containing protein [Verrucomicrobiae bacterium]|nr:PRC and DUF2382 domain-containing protein [Verrucomicrobiae bacterium]